jgi:hypothetical protein
VVRFEAGAEDFRLHRNVQAGSVTHQPPPCSVGKRYSSRSPKTGHEGPEGEQRYSSTSSFTSALEWVGGQRHAPAALTPERTQYPLYKRFGGPQGRSGRVRNISPSPRFDSQTGQPVQSLYQLRYHSPLITGPQGLFPPESTDG